LAKYDNTVALSNHHVAMVNTVADVWSQAEGLVIPAAKSRDLTIAAAERDFAINGNQQQFNNTKNNALQSFAGVLNSATAQFNTTSASAKSQQAAADAQSNTDLADRLAQASKDFDAAVAGAFQTQQQSDSTAQAAHDSSVAALDKAFEDFKASSWADIVGSAGSGGGSDAWSSLAASLASARANLQTITSTAQVARQNSIGTANANYASELAAARTQYQTGRSNLDAAQELAIATGEQNFILATGKDLPVSSLLGTVQFAALVTNPVQPPSGAKEDTGPWNPLIIKSAIDAILGSLSGKFKHHVSLVPGSVSEPTLSWSDRDLHGYGRHFVVTFPKNWTNQQVIKAVFEDTAGLAIMHNAKEAEYYHSLNDKMDLEYLAGNRGGLAWLFGAPDAFAAKRKEDFKQAVDTVVPLLETAVAAGTGGGYELYMLIDKGPLGYVIETAKDTYHTGEKAVELLTEKARNNPKIAAGVAATGIIAVIVSRGKIVKVVDNTPGGLGYPGSMAKAPRRGPALDNYRGRFNAERHANDLPRLPDDYDAHHAIPQRYMDHPEFKDFDFHAPSNIRGVKGSRADVNVHQQITNLWEDFAATNPNATRAQIEAFREQIGAQFRHHWF
jgi:hypothetical protein